MIMNAKSYVNKSNVAIFYAL